MAYRPPSQAQQEQTNEMELEFLVIGFYQVGSHENFYDTLKRYLREE